MKNITLRIINGNKVENLVLNSGKVVTKKATAGTQYQLVLCTRQISQNPYPIRLLPS